MIKADSRNILASPGQMRALDSAAINDYGIPGIVLMENAAEGIADYIEANYYDLTGTRRNGRAGVYNRPVINKRGNGRGILIICGTGNNGGDGFAAARKLHKRGFDVCILVLAGRHAVRVAEAHENATSGDETHDGAIRDGDKKRSGAICGGSGHECAVSGAEARECTLPGDEIHKSAFSGEASVNLGICERLGLEINYATSGSIGDILPGLIARSDLIIDAIFGTGFRGRPEGIHELTINTINACGAKIVSIDIPSGLDGLSGEAVGACVRADATLALGLYKNGLFSGPDSGNAGNIELIDIGIPDEAVGQTVWDTLLIGGEYIGSLLPERKRDAHKGDFGKLLIVTGSPGMTGAGCLAAEAALTAGAGLVYLAVPAGLAHIYETSVREAITIGIGAENARTIGTGAGSADDGTGGADDGICGSANDGICGTDDNGISGSADEIINRAARVDAVAIGPGMSTDADTAGAIHRIITTVEKPMIIDADALNAVAADISVLKKLKAPAVLTPHEAEMGRLLGIPAADVRRDRLALAREFARKNGVTLILKGRHSVVATPDGFAYINLTGNPGMSTAGAGDALTGIAAAFVGAGLSVPEAAVAAVYLHGLSGDLAAAELGERSVRASDLVRYLPYAIRKVCG